MSPFTYVAKSDLLTVTVPSKALFTWLLTSNNTKTFQRMKVRATAKLERMTATAIEVDKDVKQTKHKVRVGVIGDVSTTDAIK